MKPRIRMTDQPSGAVEVVAVLPPSALHPDGAELRRGWASGDERLAMAASFNAVRKATIADALELGLRVLGVDVERPGRRQAVATDEQITRARAALRGVR